MSPPPITYKRSKELKVARKMTEKHRQRYPCAQCGANLIRKKDGICRACYLANARGERLKRLSEKALKERLKPKRETRQQKEVKQARRRRWTKAPKCSSVPMWKITVDERTRHEIGKCSHFIKGKCRNTNQPCPFNGIRDFTELQNSEGKSSRSIESIGLYPSQSKLPKFMTEPSKRGRPQNGNPPPSRDFYHAPVGRVMPLDSFGSMDDIFREIER